MNLILRGFFIILVTVILVIFVTDFESVVDGFANLVDGITALLGPLKGLAK